LREAYRDDTFVAGLGRCGWRRGQRARSRCRHLTASPFQKTARRR